MTLNSAFVIFMVFAQLVFVIHSNPICESGYPKYEIPVYEEDRLCILHKTWNSGKQNIFCGLLMDMVYMAIDTVMGSIPRPLLNLTSKNIGKIFDAAFGHKPEPPFDPYKDSLSYILSCYIIPYVGMNGILLMAGLLAVDAEQDAIIRMYLYERADEIVHPYGHAVADSTSQISNLRNRLGKCGINDEGIIVPCELGAENRSKTNIISADYYSLAYSRTPEEIARIVYTTGNEHILGGIYPHGANGRIAREFLKDP
ncbi:putative GDP-mannose-dependent alpha-mannosyltransferase-like [Capsicum annuum]|nr:putative GDP-mannose-dependent alpha-mannosyltransferase-like [Capsicum annuum]